MKGYGDTMLIERIRESIKRRTEIDNAIANAHKAVENDADISDALIELAEMISAQDDALIELAEILTEEE